MGPDSDASISDATAHDDGGAVFADASISDATAHDDGGAVFANAKR